MPVTSSGPAENRCPKESGTVSSMNLRIVAQFEFSARLNQSWGPSPGERWHFWAATNSVVLQALSWLFEQTVGQNFGRQKCRRTPCVISSPVDRPPLNCLQMGTETGGDQISARAGDNRSSAYSLPQPKNSSRLRVRYGCLRGGRMECFWSKNSICEGQAGACRTRLRQDPGRDTALRPNLPLPLGRSLRRQKCIREQRGRFQDTLD